MASTDQKTLVLSCMSNVSFPKGLTFTKQALRRDNHSAANIIPFSVFSFLSFWPMTLPFYPDFRSLVPRLPSPDKKDHIALSQGNIRARWDSKDRRPPEYKSLERPMTLGPCHAS